MNEGTHRSGQVSLPLQGRAAVVTGASRRGGIGHAVACRLLALGASVLIQHHQPHDAVQEWGADDLEKVLDELYVHRADPQAQIAEVAADLAEPDAPEHVVDTAAHTFGHLDILVANHARTGGDGALGELTAEMLDEHWAVDARSVILLVQAFAACHDDSRAGGRVVLLTSGQQLGPLPGEVAYGAAKAAVAGITTTLADQLADRAITLNTVNPGPVDTGYLTDDMWHQVAPMFPLGRYGQPDDPARLICWLCTDDAGWITGQTLNTEGGFGRWRPQATAADRPDAPKR